MSTGKKLSKNRFFNVIYLIKLILTVLSVLCFQSSPGHKYCSIALCDTYDTSLESLYTADLEYQKIFSHLTLLVQFKRGVPGGGIYSRAHCINQLSLHT